MALTFKKDIMGFKVGVHFEGLVKSIRDEYVHIADDMYDWKYKVEIINPVNFKSEFYFFYPMEWEHIEGRVDAPSDLVQKNVALLKGEEMGKAFARWEREYDNAQMRVERGTYVEVIKGRKVPVGTRGRVFWVGEDRYGNIKIGIATSNHKNIDGRNLDVAWTAVHNCKRISEAMGRRAMADADSRIEKENAG